MEERTQEHGRTVSGSRLDIQAAKKRCVEMVLAQDESGWVLVLHGIEVGHFKGEEDARLFTEAIPAALEALLKYGQHDEDCRRYQREFKSP